MVSRWFLVQRLVGNTRRRLAQQIQEREVELQQLKQSLRSLSVSRRTVRGYDAFKKRVLHFTQFEWQQEEKGGKRIKTFCILNLKGGSRSVSKYVSVMFPQRQAKAAVKDSSKIFSELLEFVERRRVETKELIRAQEKAEVARAESQVQQLEQQVSELRRRDAELERLSLSSGPTPDLTGDGGDTVFELVVITVSCLSSVLTAAAVSPAADVSVGPQSRCCRSELSL